MRFIFVLLFAVLLIANSAIAQSHTHCSHHKIAPIFNWEANKRSDSIDIIHYNIDIDLSDFANEYIRASCEITLKAKTNSVQSIPLDLLQLIVDSVHFNQQSTSFNYNDTLLLIALPQAIVDSDTHTIRVFYRGNPKKDESTFGGFYFSGSYIFNIGVGFKANPHNFGRTWFPCFDNFVEKSSYEFTIKTAGGFKPVAVGKMLSETLLGGDTIVRHWKMDECIPTYLVSIAAAPYELVKDSFNTIPIELYAVANDTTNLKASFSNLKNAAEAFEHWFGSYQFNKIGYNLVPFSAGAMEHATLIAYPRATVDGSLNFQTLMAHELAHSWWGNLVTCQTSEDMWLNEGFASFCELLFLEYLYGWEEDAQRQIKSTLLNVLRKAHIDEEGYRAVSGVPHEYTYGSHTYRKGSLVANNLRRHMGDSLFRYSTKRFFSDLAFGNMNSQQFKDSLEAYSGLNLDNFFDNMVFNGGHAAFKIYNQNISGSQAPYTVNLEIKQTLNRMHSFLEMVPMEIGVYSQATGWQYFNEVIGGEHSFVSFTSNEIPELIVLNPNTKYAHAVTSDLVLLNQNQNFNLLNGLMSLTSTNTTDSSYVFVEHFWVAPDPIKDFENKPYQLSDYRYWRVTGNYEGKTELSARLMFDGRKSGDYLDSTLLSVTEDSLVLLYRENPSKDWEEYADAIKFTLNNPTDKFGYFDVSVLKPGEYAYANLNHKVLSAKVQSIEESTLVVYPNPNNGSFSVKSEFKIMELEVYTASGTLVFKVNPNDLNYSYNNRLASGNYILVVKNLENSKSTVKFTVR